MTKKKPRYGKITWIANTQTREFHRLVEGEAHDPRCRLDEIALAHRKVTRTARELRELGYDAAKWCTRKFRSKENT